MPRTKKKTKAFRANLLKAKKAKELKRSLINNKIKTEPFDDSDLDNVAKLDVKEEPEEIDNWDHNNDYEDGTTELFGETMEYSDCQDNSVSDNCDGPNILKTSVAPASSSPCDACPTTSVFTGQGKRCLLCYKECDSLDHATENKENVFRTMFIMKKMLQVPNHMLEDYLLNFGSPNSWVSLCSMCKPKVDKALGIQNQMWQLERTLRNFQAGIIGAIKKSVEWLPEIPLPSTEHVLRVTNETRKFVSTGECKTLNIRSCAESKGRRTKMKEVLKSLPSTYVNPKLSVPARVNDGISDVFSQSPSPSTLSPCSGFSFLKLKKPGKRQFSIADQIEAMRKKVEVIHGSRDPPQLSQSILNDPVSCNETIYTCNLCPHLEKMHFHYFVNHILFHHRRPYRCSVCNTYYASQKELDHSPFNEKRIKEDATGHVCTQDTLVKTRFPPEKIWSCKQCNELFDLESQRDEHEQEVHSSESENSSEMKHGCKTCGKNSRNLKDWSLHRAIEHPDVALLSCYFCDENFGCKTKEGIDVNMGSHTTVNDHVKKHHIDNKSTFTMVTCDFCGENFTRSTDLQKHVKEGHGLNTNRAFSCSICYGRTSNFTKLRTHMGMTHKAGTQERYVCDSCGYSASSRHYFEVHNLEKHGIRPERGGVRTCKVEGCKFEYLYKQYLDRHMMIVHNAARKHTCQYCGKGFLNARHRREHEQIHLNKVEKPFKCKICGNSFALRNYLYIHMRLSHLNRPFASTNKKRSRKSQRPSNSNFGFGQTESYASGSFSSGQSQNPLIVPNPDQNIDRDQPQYGETRAINLV